LVTPADLILPVGHESIAHVDGQLVYAIGDIHGCYDLLRALLAKIAEDAASRTDGTAPILIFCGDYVDRGPDAARVLDALCWLKRHAPHEVRFLKGNHEAVMLDYIRDPGQTRDWMRFGGMDTLLSYGVEPPSADDDVVEHLRARDDLLERLPVAHMTFLERLDLMLTVGDYVFVHAGIAPGMPLADQAEADLLWIRDGFLDSRQRHEKIVVHGHTWTSSSPERLINRIGVDTGAYETGVLTSVKLEDGAATFLSVGRDD
jgi:serine/threonine protein phosphatase 1